METTRKEEVAEKISNFKYKKMKLSTSLPQIIINIDNEILMSQLYLKELKRIKMNIKYLK